MRHVTRTIVLIMVAALFITVFPGMDNAVYAATKDIEVGGIYHPGDVIVFGDSVWIKGNDNSGSIEELKYPWYALSDPEGTFVDGRKQWGFALDYKEGDQTGFLVIYLGYPDATASNIPTGIKCTGGSGTQGNPYVFELVYECNVAFDTSGHGVAPGAQTVLKGGYATKPSDPTAERFHFKGWYLTTPDKLTRADIYDEQFYGFYGYKFDTTPVTENITLYAAWYADFEGICYDISDPANPVENTGGNVTFTSIYQCTDRPVSSWASYSNIEGSDITITAIPGEGKQFVGWSKSFSEEDIVSTDAEYTFTFTGKTRLCGLFTGPRVLGAAFGISEGGTYTPGCQANSGDFNDIDYPVNMSVTEGEEVTLTAKPADGYEFKGWYGGVIQNDPDQSLYGFVADYDPDKLISSDASYTFTADPSLDMVFYGLFEQHAHTLVKTDEVKAGCETDGTEAYWTCSECKKMFSDEAGEKQITEPVKIEATGHDWGEWTVTKEASATEKGIETRTCINDSSHTETRETEMVTVTYTLSGGDGGSHEKGSSETLVFTFKRSVDDSETLGHFKGIKVDGAEVAPSNYTAAAGSAVVTLKADYLDTLGTGAHTLTAVFDDADEVSGTFTVTEKAEDPVIPDNNKNKTPATGDGRNVSLYAATMLTALISIGAIMFRRKRYPE